MGTSPRDEKTSPNKDRASKMAAPTGEDETLDVSVMVCDSSIIITSIVVVMVAQDGAKMLAAPSPKLGRLTGGDRESPLSPKRTVLLFCRDVDGKGTF